MKAFVGLLAILAVASANVIPSSKPFSVADDIKDILTQYDPARISDVSLTLLDIITLTLNSASVSGFSNFALEETSNDGSAIKGRLSLPTLAANVDALDVKFTSGLTAGVTTLDASATGLTLDATASYTSSPYRLTALSALLQVADVSVKGTVQLNGAEIEITVESDVVDTINSKLNDVQDNISNLIMNIVNEVLAIIYP